MRSCFDHNLPFLIQTDRMYLCRVYSKAKYIISVSRMNHSTRRLFKKELEVHARILKLLFSFIYRVGPRTEVQSGCPRFVP